MDGIEAEEEKREALDMTWKMFVEDTNEIRPGLLDGKSREELSTMFLGYGTGWHRPLKMVEQRNQWLEERDKIIDEQQSLLKQMAEQLRWWQGFSLVCWLAAMVVIFVFVK